MLPGFWRRKCIKESRYLADTGHLPGYAIVSAARQTEDWRSPLSGELAGDRCELKTSGTRLCFPRYFMNRVLTEGRT